MLVRLDIPQRVLATRVLVARNFLLLEPPLGQFHLVTEQVTPRQHVAEAEPRPQRLEVGLGVLAPIGRLELIDLEDPVVVRVAFEAFEPVARNFVLVVDFADGRADVVRVQLLVRRRVMEYERLPVFDRRRGRVRLDVGDVGIGSRVQDEPDVVVVAVRVQRNLLFCVRVGGLARAFPPAWRREARLTLTAAGIHVRMRMQVAALSVRVANGDARTDHDVCATRVCRKKPVPSWSEGKRKKRNQLVSLADTPTPAVLQDGPAKVSCMPCPRSVC